MARPRGGEGVQHTKSDPSSGAIYLKARSKKSELMPKKFQRLSSVLSNVKKLYILKPQIMFQGKAGVTEKAERTR